MPIEIAELKLKTLFGIVNTGKFEIQNADEETLVHVDEDHEEDRKAYTKKLARIDELKDQRVTSMYVYNDVLYIVLGYVRGYVRGGAQ